MMKKFLIILVLVGTVLLSACKSESEKATPATSEYRVTKSTGLYAELDVNAEMLDTLSVGTLVIPADGYALLYCKTITDSGMDFNLCKVEVVKTGKVGWVLKKWIEKK